MTGNSEMIKELKELLKEGQDMEDEARWGHDYDVSTAFQEAARRAIEIVEAHMGIGEHAGARAAA